jgi:hypothetical protein
MGEALVEGIEVHLDCYKIQLIEGGTQNYLARSSVQ